MAHWTLPHPFRVPRSRHPCPVGPGGMCDDSLGRERPAPGRWGRGRWVWGHQPGPAGWIGQHRARGCRSNHAPKDNDRDVGSASGGAGDGVTTRRDACARSGCRAPVCCRRDDPPGGHHQYRSEYRRVHLCSEECGRNSHIRESGRPRWRNPHQDETGRLKAGIGFRPWDGAGGSKCVVLHSPWACSPRCWRFPQNGSPWKPTEAATTRASDRVSAP